MRTCCAAQDNLSELQQASTVLRTRLGAFIVPWHVMAGG